MLQNYLGNFRSGRLKTGRFLILWILLLVAFVALGLLIGLSIGLAEHLVGGNLTAAQDMLRKHLSIPAIIGAGLFAILFLVAKLNIVAKRARDIGLPGWITAIAFAGLVGGTTQYTEAGTSGGIGMLLLVVLAFIPTDTFGSDA